MNSIENIQIVDNILREIECEYQAVKGLILTESDLKCLLYMKLMKIPGFSTPQSTQEGFIYSNSVHTELSWFDDNGRLTIKPDLTILNPKELRITKGQGTSVKLPSKQFSFDGRSIIMELKFIRTPGGITEHIHKKSLIKDFEKIQKLFRRLESQGMPDQVYCYFVIFNKTDKRCESFNNFIADHGFNNNYKVVYVSGNVDLKINQNNNLKYSKREYGTRNNRFNRLRK